MKHARVAVVTALIVAGSAGGAEAAKPVTGTVESIDAAKNELKLNRTNERGQQEQVTLKWNEDLPGAQSLERAKVGSQISVEANQSFGAWEVARVMTDAEAGGSQRALKSSGRSGQAAQDAQGASRQY
jgi:hypothetical protein